MTHRYGPHDPSTAPTTVTVGAGSQEHQAPISQAVLNQRRVINTIAAGGHVEPTPAPRPGVTDDEWAIFLDAIRTAARDGVVHQSNVRPLVRGRIQPRHIGAAYSRAIKAGLLSEIRRERSDDVHGRNTNKYEPVYALAATA